MFPTRTQHAIHRAWVVCVEPMREEQVMSNLFSTSFKQIVIIIAIITTTVFISGCTDLQGAIAQTSAWRDDARTIQSDLQTQIETLESQRDQVANDPSQSALIDAAILSARTKVQALEAAIAKVDLVLDEAANPNDSLTRVAHELSPWIPAPAQGPMILGAALIATFMRSRNLKSSAVSIIESIEHALKRDPQFKELFMQHADTIRTIQTPSARKLIDATLKKSA